MSGFEGKICLVATKHGKERAIAPPFKSILKMEVVEERIDTDKFGTFSGEVDRTLKPLDCAKEKCFTALKAYSGSINEVSVVASEGTFGPHPLIPFTYCNHEILYYFEPKRKMHLHVAETFLDTNFATGVFEELESFAVVSKKWRFPSHGLIIRPNIWEDHSLIYKGVSNMEELFYAFMKCRSVSADKKVWIETDMRAHKNPTRLGAIAKLAEKLSHRLASNCPNCDCPGWGVVGVKGALPCSLCVRPTSWFSQLEYGCANCGHTLLGPREDGMEEADPEFCLNCNP